MSTRDKGQELANQVNKLREYCLGQSWQISKEYEDHDSGTRTDRPQFRQMLQDAARGEFHLLVFWVLDRLSREGTLATLKYLELLEAHGVRWRSLTEPWIDSTGPFREVVISLLASLARQERFRISEHVRAGLHRAILGGTKTGRPIGRPRVVLNRGQVHELRGAGLS